LPPDSSGGFLFYFSGQNKKHRFIKKLNILLLAPIFGYSQDIIVKHSGSRLEKVKVIAVNDYSITFSNPGETVTNTIGKAAVDRVIFESGRVEQISEPVSVKGDEGWKNVIVTNNPNEVIGLRRVGEVKAKAGGYGSLRTTKGSDRKATERLKKEVVELGGHVVFIQQHETKGRGYNANPESIQSGVAYGY
jgi:hypothetical protein